MQSTKEIVGLQLSGRPAICTMFGPHKLSMGVSDIEIVEPYLIERSRHDGEIIRHCKILLTDIQSIEIVRHNWGMGWDMAYTGGLNGLASCAVYLLIVRESNPIPIAFLFFLWTVFCIISIYDKKRFLLVRACNTSITVEIRKTDPILVEAFVESLSQRIGPNSRPN